MKDPFDPNTHVHDSTFKAYIKRFDKEFSLNAIRQLDCKEGIHLWGFASDDSGSIIEFDTTWGDVIIQK